MVEDEAGPGSTFPEDLVTAVDRLSVLTTGDMLRVGVTLAQGRALSALYTLGPQRITRLAHLDHVTQPAMTSVVRSMERLGLVERLPHETDGRVVIVALTPKGEEMIGALRAARIASIEQHLAALPPDQIEQLAAAVPVLDRLVERMRAKRTTQMNNGRGLTDSPMPDSKP